MIRWVGRFISLSCILGNNSLQTRTSLDTIENEGDDLLATTWEEKVPDSAYMKRTAYILGNKCGSYTQMYSIGTSIYCLLYTYHYNINQLMAHVISTRFIFLFNNYLKKYK